MPLVNYLPDNKMVDTGIAETILQASLRSGIPHTHVCGGNARCSTCRVLIAAGLENCAPRNAKELAMARQLHFSPDIRLACQTTITGNVKVRRLVLDTDDVDLTDQLRPQASYSQAGEEKRVAVLFADIRGFTRFAENLPPYDVIHALNRHFYRMEEIIQRHHGYVDNYMGDGLLAIFGADGNEAAPLDAVMAGIEMLDAVEKSSSYFTSAYGQSFKIGIGVHYGDVVLGSIGPPGRNRYTVIGDAVNLASRIEAANKITGTSILISADTYGHIVDNIKVNRFDNIVLPGRVHQSALYEVVGTV